YLPSRRRISTAKSEGSTAPVIRPASSKLPRSIVSSTGTSAAATGTVTSPVRPPPPRQPRLHRPSSGGDALDGEGAVRIDRPAPRAAHDVRAGRRLARLPAQHLAVQGGGGEGQLDSGQGTAAHLEIAGEVEPMVLALDLHPIRSIGGVERKAAVRGGRGEVAAGLQHDVDIRHRVA